VHPVNMISTNHLGEREHRQGYHGKSPVPTDVRTVVSSLSPILRRSSTRRREDRRPRQRSPDDVRVVPPGEFIMGSPPEEAQRDNSERQHRVQISKGFWTGKYEVTKAQYKRFLEDSRYDGTADADPACSRGTCVSPWILTPVWSRNSSARVSSKTKPLPHSLPSSEQS